MRSRKNGKMVMYSLTVAGATLIGTFVTSVAGVAFYELLAATGFGADVPVAPEWLLGFTLGLGGLVGT